MCDFLGMLLSVSHLENDIGRLYLTESSWVLNKLTFIKCFGSAR